MGTRQGMKALKNVMATLGTVALAMAAVGMVKKSESVYKNEPAQWNPMQGKYRGRERT